MSHHHTGLDCRNLRADKPTAPGDSFDFCDLRGVSFEGADLFCVRFLGCRLNGASFQRSNLRAAQFVGCFSASQGEPTDFRGCWWEQTRVIDSHLYLLTDAALGCWQWPDEEAEAAWASLSQNNTTRYMAAEKLGELGNPVTAPIVATLLSDPEWDVRSAALRTLDILLSHNGVADREHLLQWIWFRLGDEHPIVRNSAVDLVKRYAPADQSLFPALNQMREEVSATQLNGLRVASKLLDLDQSNARLVNRERLRQLSQSRNDEVRAASLAVIAMLEDSG